KTYAELAKKRVSSPMQPTLFIVRILPPPSTRPGILTFLHRPGAGGAADGTVTLAVEAVFGQPVLLSVAEESLLAPVDKGVYLQYTPIQVIPLDCLQIAAGRALLPAHAGNPAGKTLERPTKRLHLPDRATGVAFVQRLAEGEQTVGAFQLLYILMAGEVPVDLQPVAFDESIGHLVCLFVQPAGVEGKNTQLQSGLVGYVDNGHILQGEGAGQGYLAGSGLDAGREDFRRSGVRWNVINVCIHITNFSLQALTKFSGR